MTINQYQKTLHSKYVVTLLTYQLQTLGTASSQYLVILVILHQLRTHFLWCTPIKDDRTNQSMYGAGRHVQSRLNLQAAAEGRTSITRAPPYWVCEKASSFTLTGLSSSFCVWHSSVGCCRKKVHFFFFLSTKETLFVTIFREKWHFWEQNHWQT